LVRYRELCQFFVCYRVDALSHRALTEPAHVTRRRIQRIRRTQFPSENIRFEVETEFEENNPKAC